MGHRNVDRLFTHSHSTLLEGRLCDFDIIVVTETFLESEFNYDHLNIDGYILHLVGREGKSDGGVGVYVQDCYTAKTVSSSEPVYDNSPDAILEFSSE